MTKDELAKFLEGKMIMIGPDRYASINKAGAEYFAMEVLNFLNAGCLTPDVKEVKEPPHKEYERHMQELESKLNEPTEHSKPKEPDRGHVPKNATASILRDMLLELDHQLAELGYINIHKYKPEKTFDNVSVEPQSPNPLDVLEKWLNSVIKARILYDQHHYFVSPMIQVEEILSKIRYLRSEDE